MRIQHNIMAMSSYRNYTNNVSAMKANLEKLSSGYKINRAGDDAAGLAISEKMRAQITGLKQAQANAKSGINLVQTAEGALQEVQDMLNRMVKLAEQSANGTYDDDVDRNQLQKEFDRLTEEIDRINKSANFNGKALFGGPEATGTALEDDGIQAFDVTEKKMPAVKAETGEDAGGNATAAELTFAVSIKEGSNDANPTWAKDDTVTITTAGKTDGGNTTNNLTITATRGDDGWTVSGATGYTGTFDGTTLTLTASSAGATTYEDADFGTVTVTVSNADATSNSKTLTATGDLSIENGKAAGGAGKESYVEVDFAGLKGEDVIGDTVTIGDKTFEFVKTGGDAATGNIKIEVADDTTAADLATKLETALKVTANVPTGTATPEKDGTKVTVKNSTVGATALKGEATDGAEPPEDDKPVASGELKASGVDFADATTKLDTQGIAAIKGMGTAGKIKVGDFEVDVSNIDGVLTTNDTGKTAADKILEIAKSAAKAWNDENSATKGYKYDNVRISKTADGANPGDIIAQTAGDGMYILADKVKTKGGPTTDFNFQVGDTNDEYNRIQIQIKHIGSADIVDDAGTALKDLKIEDEAKAGKALKSLKEMVNYISDIRGDLGAAQNRLDHTINNLSVMEENIQDAESTIRDTDIAEEMMAYTKNNILIQSAQAMLAQANQVPQGVLQLLQ